MKRQQIVDALVEDSTVQTRQAYRKVLASRQLLDLSAKELASARATLRAQHQPRITRADIRFQAIVTRLHSRQDLSTDAKEDVFQQVLHAEYECDQAEWERDCFRAAALQHLEFTPPVPAAPPRGAARPHG